ncbi:hypothetical protein BABINDRAFT_39677 [Babjeviella inositovora NRRL Y-12698]|uniref:SWIRM domain-containing protein n=1 Tax=Babjeviella inositovora NRRL Y-12698 TaxID=984486 RepID=A0A1E3QLM1_9ASCO|nr:uncharacterized protein BABINDRAFT_39677 [Babjeviella inositovora NRRL Y-12698]ODQ78364.1 hypothetical protein BABINDRAFT_39677 [Babjeviella inositovora NRRL Y-12698]
MADAPDATSNTTAPTQVAEGPAAEQNGTTDIANGTKTEEIAGTEKSLDLAENQDEDSRNEYSSDDGDDDRDQSDRSGSDREQSDHELPLDAEEETRKMEKRARQYLAKQTKPVVIPSYAAWFALDTVHEIEKRSLPEFFASESHYKNPVAYKEYRDFMINAYRLNPLEYLTVTASRRNLAGDVASIVRVHAFLEQWGLINYQIDPKTRPSLVGPQYTGHFQITLDTPQGLAPLLPEVKAEASTEFQASGFEAATEAKTSSPEADIPLNLELRRNIYDTTADAIALREEDHLRVLGNKSYVCYICGNDATEVRYHNLRSKNVVCLRCFAEGSFPANFTAADFVQLNVTQVQGSNASWTEQEVLLLLEGVEMFENDWSKIAGHIGTRSREQTVTKFIQLPIEDRYLHKNLSRSHFLKLLPQAAPVDTSQAVVQTLAFLAKSIDSDVAARAVSAARTKVDITTDEDITRAAKFALGKLVGEAVNSSADEVKTQTSVVAQIVELQTKKLEMKIQKLSLLEDHLLREKNALEQQKKLVVVDRLLLRKQALSVKQKLVAATEGYVHGEANEESLRLVEEAVSEATAPVRAVQLPKGKIQASVKKNADKTEVLEADLEPISIQQPNLYEFWSG